VADNFRGANVSGGDLFAADEIASVKYPRVKLTQGTDGTATDVSSAAPLPVYQAQEFPAGTQVIGKVDINSSLPAGAELIGYVGIVTQPASAATTDTMTCMGDISTMQQGLTSITRKFAKIAASTSGNNTIVAAVSAKKILVLGWEMIASGTVTAKFQDGAGGTDLTGPVALTAQTRWSAVPWQYGHIITSTNTLLNINLSGAIAVNGHLIYVEVT
jgi:hypothetical protein